LLNGRPIKALLSVFCIGTALMLLPFSGQVLVVRHDQHGRFGVFGEAAFAAE